MANPLTPELPQHGVPRPGAPRHNIILTVLFRNFQADISSIREEIKDLQADISALRGERVKAWYSYCSDQCEPEKVKFTPKRAWLEASDLMILSVARFLCKPRPLKGSPNSSGYDRSLSICVPDLTCLASTVSKLLKGIRKFKCKSRDSTRPRSFG